MEDQGWVTSRVYARIGLLGNPSDGYGGKTIALSIDNFWAEVSVSEHPRIEFLPNPQEDPQDFCSLPDLARHVRQAGYYGGVRLMLAACSSFYSYCEDHGIQLPQKNFRMRYATTIPRQRGLAGSSAIVVAALNCLLEFYGAQPLVPSSARPGIALRAEEALGIAAGWQDRVVQVHGGLVYMDFNEEAMRTRGHGNYAAMGAGLLPNLYLIYNRAVQRVKDSGAVHSDVRKRWLAGDADVRHIMEEIAELADQGRDALTRHQLGKLADLMARNFALRRRLFGDQALGEENVRMVEVAAEVGAAAKFAGSGGAVVAFCPHGEGQEQELRRACGSAGYECDAVRPAPAQLPV